MKLDKNAFAFDILILMVNQRCYFVYSLVQGLWNKRQLVDGWFFDTNITILERTKFFRLRI